MQNSAYSASVTLPPDLSLLGVFWGLIADTRLMLDSNAPDRAKLAAIAGFLDERLPGPPGGMPSLLPDEADEDPVAVMTRRLAYGELFTAIAGDMAGDAISARVVRSPSSTLNRAEAEWLGSDLATRVMRRRGELRTATGGGLVARVTSVLIRERVRDKAALRLLDETDTPLGAVLDELGARREMLWLWPYCGSDAVLHSCARLWLPHGGRERPAGLATEQVLRLDWWAKRP
jgi:hypothetical protein